MSYNGLKSGVTSIFFRIDIPILEFGDSKQNHATPNPESRETGNETESRIPGNGKRSRIPNPWKRETNNASGETPFPVARFSGNESESRKTGNGERTRTPGNGKRETRNDTTARCYLRPCLNDVVCKRLALFLFVSKIYAILP